MKHEWRKKEKAIYLPKTKPEVITVPEFQFVILSGAGNPNGEFFSECITALFTVSYALKMNLKKSTNPPEGYQDWTVYPLEGVWDISEKARKEFNGKIDKDELVFDIMIRQPHFISQKYFSETIEKVKKKKQFKLLDDVQLKTITEGRCIQMMHIGSYDNEPASFEIMEEFAKSQDLIRKSKVHREIYLSDFRKVPEEKLKTTLRFQLDN